MILFSFSTVTTSVMQLGEHEWLMYLSITNGGRVHELNIDTVLRQILSSQQTEINMIIIFNKAGAVSGGLTWPVLQ